MNRAFPFVMIRLWPQHHKDAASWAELLDVLRRNRQACEEVWFCTEIGFPPLDVHQRSAARMGEAAGVLRNLGIKPGLQIANTLGHGGANPLLDESAARWRFLTGPDGGEGAPAPCPHAHEALEYVDKMSRIYGAWQPSSVWIDDDLRMSHHGALMYGCFCETCVRAFASTQGQRYDRAELVAALHESSNGPLRLAWTKFNGQSLANLAGVIAKAVHQTAPDCRMGMQQIGHEPFLYSGPDWNPILECMAETTQRPAGARLGHGYYVDHAPRELLAKSFMIARQVSRLSTKVDQICPEIDNFTHNAFGKSTHGLAIESTLHLAMGCNSLSYAVLCSGHEPMSEYEPFLRKIATWRPFWEEYVAITADSVAGGINVCLGCKHVARPLEKGERPFAWSGVNLNDVYGLAPLGLPLCVSRESSFGHFLAAQAVPGLTDAELCAVLTRGAMMDGLTAMRIQSRGMGELLSAHVSPIAPPIPYFERISADELNGTYAGKPWVGSRNSSQAFALHGVSPAARVLGFYEDRLGAIGGPATLLTENSAGGRIAIFGHYGWDAATSSAKRNQYLAAADWISRGKLPVRVDTPAQVVVVPRVRHNGKLVSALLLNASIGSTPPLKLRIRNCDARTARWTVPEGSEITVNLTACGFEQVCAVPAMPAWSVAHLIT